MPTTTFREYIIVDDKEKIIKRLVYPTTKGFKDVVAEQAELLKDKRNQLYLLIQDL